MWEYIVAIAQPWFAVIAHVLTSWLAWRIYAITLAVMVLGGSFWIANAQRVQIIEWKPERGRKPTTQKGVYERLERLAQFKANARVTVLLRLLLVVLFGFAVPSIILGAGIYFYGWLLPGRSALDCMSCEGHQAEPLSLPAIASYVISQLTLGVSGILGELSAKPPLTSAYGPADTITADGLLLYRYFVGGFVSIFGKLILNAFQVSRRSSILKVEAELNAALMAAKQRDSIGNGIVAA
jgi:hypothetical protein